MNRTVRAIVAVIFIAIIVFSAISICQNLARSSRLDITEQKLYSLSDGSQAILAKLNQPLKIKLYYAKTAAVKAPDQIQFFNEYYYFVRDLLSEYERQANGMIEFLEIDPRPYSDEDLEALRYGLKRFPITEEENFFFGLVVQTEFGVTKSIPFFSPDRQNFVEYDISSLIDQAITREKTRIGVLSSLPVFGDEASDYMAQMMQMQGQQPKPAWGIIQQLKSTYDVNKIETEIEKIDPAQTDILMVIHPKGLPEKTLFAIDQFVLQGGPTIVLVDPFCYADMPDAQMGQQAMMQHDQSSDLEPLLKTWQLEMPADTFAGDVELALRVPLGQNQPAKKFIGLLGLTPEAFNTELVATANLNDVKVLFSGVLRKVSDTPGTEETPSDTAEAEPTAAATTAAAGPKLIPMVQTTSQGNSWKVGNRFELMQPDADQLMKNFRPGSEPVTMAYLVTGQLRSAFPDGVEIPAQTSDAKDETGQPAPPDETQPAEDTAPKKLTGLTEATAPCAVAVFADVDFITNSFAYRENPLFGMMVVGDNSNLLLNTIEYLSGSTELVAIRSRGNFSRPFTVVEEIEQEAEKQTAEQVKEIEAAIAGYEQELRDIVNKAREKGESLIETSEVLKRQNEVQVKIQEKKMEHRNIMKERTESIEQLGSTLRNWNMLAAPVIILLVAIVMGLRRSIQRRTSIQRLRIAEKS